MQSNIIPMFKTTDSIMSLGEDPVTEIKQALGDLVRVLRTSNKGIQKDTIRFIHHDADECDSQYEELDFQCLRLEGLLDEYVRFRGGEVNYELLQKLENAGVGIELVFSGPRNVHLHFYLGTAVVSIVSTHVDEARVGTTYGVVMRTLNS